MKHTDIVEIFENKDLIGTETVVCGWVRTSRESKNMAFIELNDGTSLKHLQIVIDKSELGDVSDFMKLGTSLKVTGTVVKSAVAEEDVLAMIFREPAMLEQAREIAERLDIVLIDN